MVIPTIVDRMLPRASQALSPAQHTFVEAAEALGATAPGTARPLPELPRLRSAELDDLVERGLVREAADRCYYVFRSRRDVAWESERTASGESSGLERWTHGRVWRMLIFWLLVILIPILLLQLTARH